VSRELRYDGALAEALDEVLSQDERVTLIGAGFTGFQPGGTPVEQVRQKYAARIKYPPIAELAYCGIGVGAALAGVRPIVEISTATFSYEAIPQIVNEAAIICSNSGGAVSAPVVFHMLYGIRGAGAAQHSGSPQPWYANTPGLHVVMPSSPADVKGLLRWAVLESSAPTVFMNHARLMRTTGPVPEGPYEIPFGRADVKRSGRDVTVVACGVQVPRALEAAERLASESGIDVEVVDPRTIQPLDVATILDSVRKTGRVVVTDESHDLCGVAAGIAAILADQAFGDLRAPIKRVSMRPAPVSYARPLEDYLTPRPDRIVEAVGAVVA
jgi:acetoin:2,6-dichlorophenolindophenol oxidoreductase subunit beta